MYCIKCGVELAESEKKCPLCNTKVYHPDIEIEDVPGPYPEFHSESERVNRAGVLFIITMFFALAFILSFFIDWRANRELTWSGFATGGILLVYVCLVLPFWFHRPDAIVLVNVDFAVVALFLLYINFATNGSWFLGFAFPVTLAAAGITTGTIAVVRYVRRGYLFITAGVWAALGVYAVLIEYLINRTFGVRDRLIWSPYPFIACVMIGATFLVIAISRPLRDSLYKKFFI
ncbi:MAG: hypothetical protein GX257_09725 [Clostridiales bacterium]|nr:hypothetical protein [Clostridiales bacterium]